MNENNHVGAEFDDLESSGERAPHFYDLIDLRWTQDTDLIALTRSILEPPDEAFSPSEKILFLHQLFFKAVGSRMVEDEQFQIAYQYIARHLGSPLPHAPISVHFGHNHINTIDVLKVSRPEAEHIFDLEPMLKPFTPAQVFASHISLETVYPYLLQLLNNDPWAPANPESLHLYSLSPPPQLKHSLHEIPGTQQAKESPTAQEQLALALKDPYFANIRYFSISRGYGNTSDTHTFSQMLEDLFLPLGADDLPLNPSDPLPLQKLEVFRVKRYQSQPGGFLDLAVLGEELKTFAHLLPKLQLLTVHMDMEARRAIEDSEFVRSFDVLREETKTPERPLGIQVMFD